MKSAKELPIYDYNPNAVFPHLQPFRSSTVCNWEENGMFVLAENLENRKTEIWLYKFARKAWFQMGPPHCGLFQSLNTPKPMLEKVDSGILLMFGHNIHNFGDKFQIFTYDIKAHRSEMIIQTNEGPVDFALKTYEQARKYENCIYVIGKHDIIVPEIVKKLKIFDFDIEKATWKSSYDLLDAFENKQFEFIVHDNKILVFVFECVKNVWQCSETIFCFDLLGRNWCEVKTNPDLKQRPNGMKICNLVKYEDTVYAIGGFTMGRVCRNIWRFEVSTFMWSLMPLLLPSLRVGFMSDFTAEGQMFVAYDDGICQINFAKRARPLMNLCFDKIVSQPDFISVKGMLDDNILFPEKYRSTI